MAIRFEVGASETGALAPSPVAVAAAALSSTAGDEPRIGGTPGLSMASQIGLLLGSYTLALGTWALRPSWREREMARSPPETGDHCASVLVSCKRVRNSECATREPT